MTTLFKDVRYGARGLLKQPGFTAIALITLALGIGANTAIFSVVRAVLLRPLPFPNSERLVVINDQNNKTGETIPSVSPADFFDWKSQSKSFESLAAYSGWPLTVIESGQSETIPASRVTGEFFTTLRVQPILGRIFARDEFTAGSSPVILSNRLWQRRFGGDPNVIGKTIDTQDGHLVVVGVIPADFKLPATAEAWTPVAENSSEMTLRASRYFQAVGRLKPDVSLNQAEAEIKTIASRLASQYPEADSNWSVRLSSLRESIIGDAKTALWILFGAVCLVLLIACSNVANLELARATSRNRELAIRGALGASRWRILRQMLAEGLLLSIAGSALGLLLAMWLVNGILWLIPKDLRFPRIEEAHVDFAVLGFTFVVAILVSLAISLIPGLKASRPDLRESLNEGGRSATVGVRLRRLRGFLVVAEIGLTMILLAGAGLLIKSLVKMQHVDLGFQSENLLGVPVGASMTKYADPQARAGYFQRLVDAAQNVPGVQAVATASSPPMMYTMFFPFAVVGQSKPNEVPQAWFSAVSSNYFDVMGIRTLSGREFDDHDTQATFDAAIINKTMRQHYFQNDDAIGKQLNINYLGQNLTVRIVGVVDDVKQESVAAPINSQIYVSANQQPWFSTSLMIRTDRDPSNLQTAIASALRSADPAQSGSGAKAMEQSLSDSVALPRFYSLLLGSFAGLALLLAAVGVYGVISYSVAQRTYEMGIRMALGAQVRNLIGLVIRQGMTLVSVGVVIGTVGAYLVTRLMKDFLFGVGATDPATFTLAAVLLGIVAIVACYIPARRATRVDPSVLLR